ncbi:MAG: SH3 domain-containing protein [Clostridia bacterium]|nr:SH3 domain-containing protein [Clostridia bacterium]
MRALLRRGFALLLVLCLLPLAGGAAAEERVLNGVVRVWLSSMGQISQVDLTVSGSYSLDGTVATALPSGSSLRVTMNTSNGHLTLTRSGVSSDMGTDFRLLRHGEDETCGVVISQARTSNRYPGDIRFLSVQSGGAYRLYVIVHVFMEDYLRGVLPYEMGSSAPLEALKAQCISARTYTLRAMQAASARTYDVVDTTSDQVYNGTPSGNAACVTAVQETRGIALLNGTAFAATYYTASNGGQSESVHNIWGSSGYPYLRVKDDPYDLGNTASQSRSFFVSASGAQTAALAELLNAKAKTVFSASSAVVTAVTNVLPHTPRYAEPSRLYTKLDFDVTATCDGVSRTGRLTFDIFSELEGPLSMSINSDNNELWSVTPSAGGFTVTARRYGHGAGLSQRGAMRMAALGYNCEQILAFYYEGCTCAAYTLVRTLRGALGSSSAAETTRAEAPAAITNSGATAAIVQVSSMQASLPLRVAASATAGIIAGVPHGAVVKLHAAVGSWYLVTYGELTGYASADGLRLLGLPDGQQPSVTTLTAYGTAQGDQLNLRQGAGTSYASLIQIPAGAELPLLSVSNGWAKTQYGALAGYVSMNYVKRTDSYAGTAAEPSASGAQLTADCPLYLSPSRGAHQAAQLQAGDQVTVKYDDGSWSMVWTNGVTGYVPSTLLNPTGISTAASEDTPQSGEQYATVNSTASSLNLRAQASMNSEILAEIPYGEKVIVSSLGDTWCRVRWHGVEGWCMRSYLQLGSEQQDQTALTAVVTTASGSLNLRKSDSTNSTILTTIPRNATISVLERGTTWSKVTYGGFIGYVMSKFLTFGNSSATPVPTAVPVVTPVPTSTPNSGTARVTTASGSLNLRREPATGNNIIARIPQNAIVQVLGISGTWTRVSYNGHTGYVMSTFLTYTGNAGATATPAPAVTAAPTASSAAAYARVTTASGSLNLRKAARSSAGILAQIPQYTVVTVEERLGTWTRVTYNGRTGYVMTTFLTFVDVDTTPTPRPTENVSGTVMTARVTTERGSLNLRERAASGAKILTTIPQYATVTVLTRGNTWSHVTYGSHTGYVMSSFLTFTVTDTPATPAPVSGASEPYARVTTQEGSLNLRARATLTAEILTRIPQNAVVTVLEKGAVWTQVSYGSRTGYVKTQFLTFFASSANETAVLPVAQTAKIAPGTSTVTLRASADETSASLAAIARGEYVLIIARGSVWCQISYEGSTGYVLTADLELP